MKKSIAAATAAVAAASSLALAAPAAADDMKCVDQYWLYGGLFGRGSTRVICDGPIAPDGSWERRRGFFADHYIKTTCSGGYYSSSCTTRQVPELKVIDIYRVTPYTVLPDEPGHIDQGF